MASNSSGVKTTLFRFATVRQAEQVTPTEDDVFFIKMPTPSVTLIPYFYQAAKDIDKETLEERQSELKSLIESYRNSSSWVVSNLKSIDGKSAEFERWLARNKRKLTVSTITAAKTQFGISTPFLSAGLIDYLWDNLICCVVGQDIADDIMVALRRLIRLDYLLNNYDAYAGASNESVQLVRLANADVLMPDFPFENFRDNSEPETVAPDYTATEERLEKRASAYEQYTIASALVERLQAYGMKQIKELKTGNEDEQAQKQANLGFITNTNKNDFGITYVNAIIDAFDAADDPGVTVSVPFNIADVTAKLKDKAHKEFAKSFVETRVAKKVVPTPYGLLANNPDYLPKGIAPLPEEGARCNARFPTSRLCCALPFKIADLRVVTQELCDYKMGEIAHIEPIMIGESKKRTTTKKVEYEQTTRTTTDKVKENESELQTTERNEMQQHTSSILSEDTSLNFSANLTASYGGTLSLSAGSSYSQNSSSQESAESAKDYAKETTERALERIMERITEDRISTVRRSLEEIDEHSLSNLDGTQHINGTYRWLNKFYCNKLENKGKRLMLELYVPEPAAFHIYAVTKGQQEQEQAVQNNNNTLVEPLDPSIGIEVANGTRITLNSINDLNDSNYQVWAAEYGAEVSDPPVDVLLVTKAMASAGAGDSEKQAVDCSVDMPEGYFPTEVQFEFMQDNVSEPDSAIIFGSSKVIISNVFTLNHAPSLNVNVNNDTISTPARQNLNSNLYGRKITAKVYTVWGNLVNPLSVAFNSSMRPAHGVLGQFPVSVVGSTDFFSVNYTVTARLSQDAYDKWRRSVYNAIMAAYKRQKDAYDTAAAAALQTAGQNNNAFVTDFGTNPLFNRDIERTELKRNAVYIMNGGRLPLASVWQDAYAADMGTAIPSFNACKNFGNAPYLSFMESAFDWQNMTYQFYNYFYANQSRWVKLYNFTDNDPLFANFLKAGYARILVPVMPGREREVLSFTLMGWNPGTTLPMLSNDAYIKGLLADLSSIEPEEQPETESWITKVPTSLICLQPEAPFEQEDACDCDSIN